MLLKMYLNDQPDPRRYVSIETRRRLHVLYLLIATFALAVGISGMWRVWREVGRPFGGFVWGWTFTTQGFIVQVETPWHWPGPRAGLRGSDRILAIDGQAPMAFPSVYEAREVGEEITYLLRRGNRLFTVQVPLSRFTMEQFLEMYGSIFLIGLSCLLAGYFLIRGARDRPTILVAFALLAMSGAALYHGHNGSISRFYLNVPLLLMLFTPSYPLYGALLAHFFLIFPQPLSMLQRRPWLPRLPYIGVVTLVLCVVVASQIGGQLDTVAFRLSLLLAALGALLCPVRALWASVRSGSERRGRVGGLGVAMAIGFLLLLSGGVIPFFSGGTSILLSSLLIPLIIIYPLALVYALKNAELIGQLRDEVALQQQLEAEARELRGIRERTLHEVADALHDTVVADVRGLQLWLAGMRRKAGEEAGADFAFLEETLERIYRNARHIMEGAKPVDFAVEGLLAPLERSLAHFRHANPGLEVHLESGSYDEDYPAAVKEEVYWIVQTALANSRDHAAARCVTVALDRKKEGLRLSVRDDGKGFDVDQALEASEVSERRRLGLRNMQMRAARIGAELDIKSGSQGTEVRLKVPLTEGTGGTRRNSGN